jgi:hypothetical protein
MYTVPLLYSFGYRRKGQTVRQAYERTEETKIREKERGRGKRRIVGKVREWREEEMEERKGGGKERKGLTK